MIHVSFFCLLQHRFSIYPEIRKTMKLTNAFLYIDSLSYIEISDATAISFLVPTWTAILCYIWLKVSHIRRGTNPRTASSP